MLELRNQNFRGVDAAIHEYMLVTGKKLDPLGPEPQLSDFYVPSNDQKDFEIAFIVQGMTATCLVAYKLAKWSAK